MYPLILKHHIPFPFKFGTLIMFNKTSGEPNAVLSIIQRTRNRYSIKETQSKCSRQSLSEKCQNFCQKIMLESLQPKKGYQTFMATMKTLQL